MITALCWVPKGALKYSPEVVEPPSKEEIEELIKSGALERSGGDEDGDEEGEEEVADEVMDVDASAKPEDEVAQALAAAQALGGKSPAGFPDIADGLRELNMDHYDEEDDGIEFFSKGLGDTYYPSNNLDPYLLDKDDEDEDEIDDLNIKPTDGVLVGAHHEEDISQLKVLIYELDDGEPNMYIHHEIILPAYPLCLAWMDCKPNTGDKGNFIAVGSMEPAIEIWDLDTVDEVEPFMILGGFSKKKKKTAKKSVKYKKDSHKDAVLGLAWNKEVRNVLASGSADKSVKVWDVVTGQCALTVKHHSDKVQAIAWNRHSPEILLSGSFDRSVLMMDMRSNAHVVNKWSVSADVESLMWNPHVENAFLVSLEDGTVQGFDSRAVSSNSSTGSSPSFTLHAHDKAVCSVSFNPSAANLLATGSMDKMVKLWDLSNNQPSCLASKNPKAGVIFSVAFYDDSPFLLAIGGSKGKMQVWDTLSEHSIASKFGNPAN